jgi:hypothetical protein
VKKSSLRNMRERERERERRIESYEMTREKWRDEIR